MGSVSERHFESMFVFPSQLSCPSTHSSSVWSHFRGDSVDGLGMPLSWSSMSAAASRIFSSGDWAAFFFFEFFFFLPRPLRSALPAALTFANSLRSRRLMSESISESSSPASSPAAIPASSSAGSSSSAGRSSSSA